MSYQPKSVRGPLVSEITYLDGATTFCGRTDAVIQPSPIIDRYAYSGFAMLIKEVPPVLGFAPHTETYLRHTVGILEASNADEATGKALRLCRAKYPPDRGWRRHDVVVTSVEAMTVAEEFVAAEEV